MSERRTTSYWLLLLRTALGRMGRTLAYYWVSLRAQVRTWRSSYHVTMVGHRIRDAASATGRLLLDLPRRFGALLGLVAWFFGQLRPYVSRVLADRREDRAELRAERRLLAGERRAQSAARRARRQAELAEIKASRTQRPHSLPVPAWISRMERPERPRRERRVPVPRRALLAAALTLAAAVPAYSAVSGALTSDHIDGVAADTTAGPGAAAAAGNAAPTGPVAVSGDTGEFVRTLPPPPTAAPRVPAPLTQHQEREVRRQAKWEAKLARAAAAVGDGK